MTENPPQDQKDRESIENVVEASAQQPEETTIESRPTDQRLRDALKEYSRDWRYAAEEEDEFHGNYYAELRRIVNSPIIQKSPEKLDPSQIAILGSETLVHLSGYDAATDLQIAESSPEIQADADRRYVQSERTLLHIAEPFRPKKTFNPSAYQLAATLDRLREYATLLPELAQQDAAKMAAEDPRKLLKAVDESLWTLGNSMRHKTMPLYDSALTRGEMSMAEYMKQMTGIQEAVLDIVDLQRYRRFLTGKVYGREDATPLEVRKMDKAETEVARGEFTSWWGFLKEGFGEQVRLDGVGLDLSDLETCQYLAKGAKELWRKYRQDKRPRSEKNPEYIEEAKKMIELAPKKKEATE